MAQRPDRAGSLFRKALGDAVVVGILAQRVESPVWAIGFHAQQAVEKFLKSVMEWNGTDYPFTHDLEELLGVLNRARLPAPPDCDEFSELSQYGVAFRYNNEPEIPQDERNQIIDDCRRMTSSTRLWAESFIGPEGSADAPSTSEPVL